MHFLLLQNNFNSAPYFQDFWLILYRRRSSPRSPRLWLFKSLQVRSKDCSDCRLVLLILMIIITSI